MREDTARQLIMSEAQIPGAVSHILDTAGNIVLLVGIPFPKLKEMDHVVVVAAGAGKARALRAASIQAS